MSASEDGRRRRILVVDDDEEILSLAVLALKQAGFEVLSAFDGEEGIRVAREARPELMLLDLAMPRMHGYEVCEAIRADKDLAGIKIIVTSGKSFPVDVKMAMSVGADLYVPKPYRIQEIISKIKELLGA